MKLHLYFFLQGSLLFSLSYDLKESFLNQTFRPFSYYKEDTKDSLKKKVSLKEYCKVLQKKFQTYNWASPKCQSFQYKFDLYSAKGFPLIYKVFGKGEHTTLVLSAVHPDELSPLPMGFKFAEYLNENPPSSHERIVVAPLVNPDGFFRQKPSRTNSEGVDPNRNFLTRDWYKKAREFWISKKDEKLRYFPGYIPNSAVETIFQTKLIDMFPPNKILSVHAPLGFLDYDGPGDRKPKGLSHFEKKAKSLVKVISKVAKNYRVVDYSFYPGSLGNYGGNERRIPTVTLELETTRPDKVEEYWKQFLPGLLAASRYKLESAP